MVTRGYTVLFVIAVHLLSTFAQGHVLKSMMFGGNKTFIEINCKQCIICWEGELCNVRCIIPTEKNYTIQGNLYKNGVLLTDQETYNTTVAHIYIMITHDLTRTDASQINGTKYRCETEDGDGRESIETKVLLLRRPSQPLTHYPNPLKEHNQGQITCTSRGTYPRPEFSLEYNKTSQLPTSVVTSPNDDGNTAAFDVNFTRYDNKENVKCCVTYRVFEVQNETEDKKTNCSEDQMNIHFLPLNAGITMIFKQNHVNGDTSLHLRCYIGPSYPVTKLAWEGLKDVSRDVEKNITKDGVTGGRAADSFLIANLTREDNGREIKCIATNEQFPSYKQTLIHKANITYEPVVTINDNTAELTSYVGKEESLRCKADGNPPPLVTWYRNGSVVRERQALTLDLMVVLNETGTFQCTCEAHNGIGAMKNASILINVRDQSERRDLVKENDTSSSLLLGVLFAVLVLVIASGIIITIVVCRRRKNGGNEPARAGSYHIRIEARKQSQQPTDNGPLYSNASRGEAESVEYAAVLPKQQRPSHQGDNSQLIYADLCLSHGSPPSTSGQPVIICSSEPTEYVSIDFGQRAPQADQSDDGTQNGTMVTNQNAVYENPADTT